MKGSEILKKVLDEFGINANQLAKELEMSRTQGIYDILDDTVGISKKMANKMVSKFPHLNKSFLLTGEGDMFNTEINTFLISKLTKSEATLDVILETLTTLVEPDELKREKLINKLNDKIQAKVSSVSGKNDAAEHKPESG